MNCRRAQELFSDHADGTLPAPLEGELRTHLDTCDDCRSLVAALRDVTGALEALSVPTPPIALGQTLAKQLADAARTRLSESTDEAAAQTPRDRMPTRTPARWLAVAAVIATLLWWRPPELASEISRKTSRTVHQVYSLGVRTYHQGEQWIEDLNVLRITVGVAFENRLDRINEQLRDLEQASQRSNGDGEQSRELRQLHHQARAHQRVAPKHTELPRSAL